MVATRNRARDRVPVRLQVNYTYEGCYLISFSGDLSADGIYVCTDRPAPVGTLLTLVFPFPNHQEIAAGARVVWSGPDRTTGQWGMGLQFLDLPPLLRKAFLDIVDRIAILGSDLGAPGKGCGTA
ncbi:MAG TPA: PilZ domain-containing protein [Deferrisomatales bacterium]|nr:PilZ domain-containing protein [Deferrisomatales bacterium]